MELDIQFGKIHKAVKGERETTQKYDFLSYTFNLVRVWTLNASCK